MLIKLKKYRLFQTWIDDISGSGINIIKLKVTDYSLLIKFAEEYNLDFDDAYQCAVAEKHGLEIVSFDSDFDRTKRKRKEPRDAF